MYGGEGNSKVDDDWAGVVLELIGRKDGLQ